jgi:DNA-binding Xre family transcriptional regulator
MLQVRKAPNKGDKIALIEEIKVCLIDTNIKEDVRNRLYDLMQIGGWSNKSLALISGLSDTTIRRILNEEQDVTLETLHKICLALDIKLSEFLENNVGWKI